MYRIIFDPSISRYVVQILRWHLFWAACYREVEGPGSPTKQKITFGTWKDAVAWASSIGLRDAYAEQRQSALYSNLSSR